MGMFDYVDVEHQCPSCKNEVIKEFQSKDGPCLLEHLTPDDVDRYYGTCPGCGMWVECERIPNPEWRMTMGGRRKGDSKHVKDFHQPISR